MLGSESKVAQFHMQTALDEARKELLDFSLRNNFLNYRSLKARGIEFTSDSAARVASLIQDSSRPFRTISRPAAEEALSSFLAKRELAREAASQHAIGELQSKASLDLRLGQSDHVLIADCTEEELDKRLGNTARLARSMLEEQGVNTLFLVLGALHWKESDTSDRLLRSPLYLVPVTLDRSNVAHGFQIKYEGEDIQGNRTLQERLKAESISIELPDEDVDLEVYLNSVAASISRKPDWTVDTSHVSLGFFSFTRYLMYLDLDLESWPNPESIGKHAVVGPLLGQGFAAEDDVLRSDIRLDAQPAYDEAHHVMEADSSQSEAVIQALSSRALVVQGPPGTGKSQTITNLLAEAVAQGKRVLFVAEKMAALEVVKRRLDQVGLGDAALELHSNKANRAAVVEELKRTVDLGEPLVRVHADKLKKLRKVRDRLNEYSDALHTPIGNTGKTPFQLFGEMEAARTISILDPRDIGLEVDSNSGSSLADKVRDLARQIEAWSASHGAIDNHPYSSIGLTTILPELERRWLQMLSRTLDAIVSLDGLPGNPLVAAWGQPADTLEQMQGLVDDYSEALGILSSSEGLDIGERTWRHNRDALVTAANFAENAAAERVKMSSSIPADTWLYAANESQEVFNLRQSLTRRTDIFYRWFSREYRRAAEKTKSLAGINGRARHTELADFIEALGRYSTNASSFLGRAQAWRAVAPEHIDVMAAASIAKTVRNICAIHERSADDSFHERLGALGVLGESRVREEIGKLREILAEANAAVDLLVSELRLSSTPTTIKDWRRLIEIWRASPERLSEAAAWNRIRNEAVGSGLSVLTDGVMSGVATPENLESRLMAGIARSWLDEAFEQRPQLANFSIDEHGAIVEEFQSLDSAILEANRGLLAQRHYRALPKLTGLGQTGVLLAEFNKKRRHLPIRRLMERAGSAIQSIKPIFMMSPLSVAVYLPRGTIDFDIVVFDEASQVRPSDALGALLRGKSAIVVGDDKQLPPTSFFDTVLSDESESAEEDISSNLADMESILGVFGARGAKELMLKWHYRSRHESLIAVSNQEFYEHKLLLFPSPDQDRSDSGIRFHHLPDTAYDRGRTRANQGEAKAVARAVVEHIRSRPDLSLGVATFSSAQAEAIEAELEVLTRGSDIIATFEKAHPYESFFVKNLETVQGDERDVILISVGYGKDQAGRLHYNFGPLNREGGHRRLNVLITRARVRTEVFANFTDEDMDSSRTNAFGVRALKTYLRYARTGVLDALTIGERDEESPFEDQVFEELKRRGHVVHRQVGQAGYFIDMAVADQTRPGRMLLGIECDGATYHSSRSARERDRLRQAVLEGLGWRIHRVWSTDWFRNRESCLGRIEEAIAEAMSGSAMSESNQMSGLATPQATQFAPPVVERAESEGSLLTEIKGVAYTPAVLGALPKSSPFHELKPDKVAKWIRAVVTKESPVKVEVAGRRVANAYGISRMGNRVRGTINSAVMYGIPRKYFDLVDKTTLVSPDFDRNAVTPRDRSGLAPDERQFSHVPGIEVDAAIMLLCRASHGLVEGEVASAAAQLLGFGRASAAIQQAVKGRVSLLVAQGRITREKVGEGVFLQVAL